MKRFNGIVNHAAVSKPREDAGGAALAGADSAERIARLSGMADLCDVCGRKRCQHKRDRRRHVSWDAYFGGR